MTENKVILQQSYDLSEKTPHKTLNTGGSSAFLYAKQYA